MNIPLRRLGVVIALMLVALMLSTTGVQFFQAPSLNADARNVRTLYREYATDRGPIVVAGESIAYSEPTDHDLYAYQRIYSQGPLYAHLTGYFSTAFNSSTGIERYANDVLGGTSNSLLLSRIQDLFTGAQPQGGSVELTIDPVVQQAIADALGNQRGAAVAIDPTTGAILGAYSSPSFDPNVLATHDRTAADEAWNALSGDPNRPLDNRITGSIQYPPGSTFKVVVAAAFLEQDLTRNPDTLVPTPAQLTLPQTSSVVHDPANQACGPADEGTLLYALQESCNTTFVQLAMDLGWEEMNQMASDLGFGRDLAIPITVTPSTYPAVASDAELGLTGMGQFDVRASVLQMAMVAAAVANDGTLMQPYLVSTERDADLAVVGTTQPQVFSEPFSADTAADLTTMMTAVVANGTGTPAQISGVTVAGKTGTAQTGNDQNQHAWMIAFAPAENPQVAVALVLENGGDAGAGAYGGSAAGPLVKRVIEAALQ